MKISINKNNIHSAKDLEIQKQVLKAYISNEEKKVLGRLPSLSHPVVTKLAGIAGAFVLKAVLKKVLKRS